MILSLVFLLCRPKLTRNHTAHLKSGHVGKFLEGKEVSGTDKGFPIFPQLNKIPSISTPIWHFLRREGLYEKPHENLQACKVFLPLFLNLKKKKNTINAAHSLRWQKEGLKIAAEYFNEMGTVSPASSPGNEHFWHPN